MSAARSCCGSSSPRTQLPQRLANIPPCLIGMEACAGAHHIGRQLQALGDNVRLIPAQYVKMPGGGERRPALCKSKDVASISMRIVASFVVLALALASHAAQAQGQVPKGAASASVAAKTFSPEEGAAMAEAQRKKSEALERTRDEKLKRTTKSICVGC